MNIRPATLADVEAAAEIYDNARAFMRESGNPTQWPGAYPAREDIIDGINSGVSYVCCENDEIVATFHFEENARDAVYKNIFDGEWKSNDPYAVIHRIAVKYHGRGIVDYCFSECFRRFPNLKIDTHEDNIPMQKCLRRAGFDYCGIVFLQDGSKRLAYQKTK
ncbi:MAG: GNAT family N-acetyltransferase [Clostridia bacterium]|nr:GNAT family N-acetyltransferase [Clostridia bacterium]